MYPGTLFSTKPTKKQMIKALPFITLEAIKLSALFSKKREQALAQAVEWAEKNWGYLENFNEKYQDDIQKHADQFYIVYYDAVIAGMFCLYTDMYPQDPDALKLDYLYVEPNLRGFGVGSKIVKLVKQKAQEDFQARVVNLETFHLSLNKFYCAQGANILCDETHHAHYSNDTAVHAPSSILQFPFA